MNREVTGRIHSIESFGSVDGPGIRYVLFLQGCPLKCLYCHNPDTWAFDDGKIVTAGEIVDDIATNRNFIEKGGVTISGGEPLLQQEFCAEVLDGCHELGLHTALDTSGIMPVEMVQDVLDKADLILLDIKSIDETMCETITGASNRNALATLRYREERGMDVWIRHVVVPGYTLDFEMLARMADYLKDFSCIKKVELLPFHKMGEYKWKELGRHYSLTDVPEPSEEDMKKAAELFDSRGIKL